MKPILRSVVLISVLVALGAFLAGGFAPQKGTPISPGVKAQDPSDPAPALAAPPVATVGAAPGPTPAVPATVVGGPAGEMGAAGDTNVFAAFNDWASRYAKAAEAARPQLVSAGVALGTARRAALRELIKTDPRAALRAALPTSVRAGMPVEVSSLLEEPVSARGDLNVLFGSPPAGQERTGSEPVIRTVHLPGRFFYAYTYGRRLRQMSTRATSIIGIAIDDRLALLDRPYRVLETAEAAARPDAALLEAAGTCSACGQLLPKALEQRTVVDTGGSLLVLHSPLEVSPYFTAPDGTTIWAAGGGGGTGTNSWVVPETDSQGDKKFLFMRVRFADDDPGYEPETDAQVRGDLDTTMRRYAEMSYGSLQGKYGFTPTLTLPKPRAGYMNGFSDVDGMYALLNDAKTKAGQIASDPAFPGVPYPFHPTNYSIFAARWNGEPGGCCSWGGGGNAWLRWDGASVIIHEWGHAIGEPHANWWNPLTEDPIGPGTHEEYGNKFDNMGGGGIEEDYGAMHKALVKWLPATNFWTVTNNGVYRIYAHDQPTLIATNRYGLRTFRASRDDTYYWLEHRAYTVSGANAPYWANGVAVTREWDWELLDLTPGSAKGKDDCPLTIGRTWSDAAAGVHFTPLSRGGSPQPWIEVAVNFDDPSHPNYPPVAVVTASSYAVAAGVTIGLAASATDPDGDPLAYAWDFGDGNISFNNQPIQNKNWSAGGTYRVQCIVSDRRGGTCVRSVLIKVGTTVDYSISGTVTAADGTPMANVRISEASGKMAMSDSDGRFTLGRLTAGSYTLTAVRNGDAFTPASRTVTVAPNAVGVDFTSATVRGPGSGLVRQVWLNLTGDAVSDLTNRAAFPNNPSLTERLAEAFETPLDWEDYYGQRVRGLFVPPLSGGYRFYIASDDYSELYLSPTTNAANKTRIAFVSGWTDSRQWTAFSSQRSGLIQLAAGQRYYIEALQTEGSGGDHLAVGVDLPDGSTEKPIPYHRLVPLETPAMPTNIVAIAATLPATAEGASAGAVTLTRYGDTSAPLEVYFRPAGTATYGADYGATGVKATIPAGQAETTVAISPLNDTLAEIAETVVLTLVPGTNYVVAAGAGEAAVTILDNDGTPAISVVASDPNASKVGPDPGRFTIQRAGSASSPLTVHCTLSGTAANGVDYQPVTNTVLLAENQASADVVILPNPAAGLEPPKTVVLSVAAGAGYTVTSPSSATLTIAQPGPGLGLLREYWNEIGSAGTVASLTNFAGFPATQSGREFLSNAAEGPHDWADHYGQRLRGWFIPPMSGPYYFYIASDDGGELWLGTSAVAASRRRIAYVNGWVNYRDWTAQGNQRSVGISLIAGQRYYLEALHAEGEGGDHCSIGVQFPGGALERPVSAQWLEPWTDKGVFAAVYASAPAAAEGGAPGEFTLKRTGAASGSLTVIFTITGTATSGIDFTALGTSATFTNGQSELKLAVHALLDAPVEGPETVTLTLRSSPSYDLGLADAATVTIIADPPRATLSALDADLGEAGGNTGTVRISMPSATYGPVTFNYTLSGTAIPGVDYAPLPGSITLLPGQAATSFLITPLADDLNEGPETLTLSLAPGDGYLPGSTAAVTLTIADANTNRPPVFAPIADQALFAGQTLMLTNAANDADPGQAITFDLVSAPEGMILDGGSGVLSWRPTLAQSPLATQVLVAASDNGAPVLSVTQSFWVTVNRPAIQLAVSGLGPEGLRLRWFGDPGPDLTLQRSTNCIDWSALVTTNSPVLPLEWTDAGATNLPGAFYRLLLGP